MKSIIVIILIFLLMQFLGLYIGNEYIQLIRAGVAQPPEVIPGVSPNNPEISFFLFAYMLVTTAVILFIIRIRKSFLRGLEAFVVFISSWLTFSFLIPSPAQEAWISLTSVLLSPLGGAGTFLISIVTLDLIFALALTVWKALRPTIVSQNVAAIFSGSGVGAILGLSLGIAPSIIFMMILSVYDFVSVFITKHMVSMAKAVTERPMAFTIASPHKFKQSKYIHIKGAKKRVHVFQLGLGDVIIPMMFSVSILNSFTILNSIITVIGSLAALIVLTIVITRKPMALPALPFVCTGALAGYLISLLII